MKNAKNGIGKPTSRLAFSLPTFNAPDGLLMSWLFPFLIIPPVVGWLTGWFVGVSQSPVVAALIPLLFGVGTAMSYMFSDRHTFVTTLQDNILDLDEIKSLPESAKQRLSSIIGTSHLPIWLPILWTASSVVFCWSLYYGTQSGIDGRIKEYPAVRELVGDSIYEQLDSQERSVLMAARNRCIAANVPVSETRQFFSDAVLPLLQNDGSEPELPDGYTDSRATELRSVSNIIKRVVPKDRRQNPLTAEDANSIMKEIANRGLESFKNSVVIGIGDSDVNYEVSIKAQLPAEPPSAATWLSTLDVSIALLNVDGFATSVRQERLARLRGVLADFAGNDSESVILPSYGLPYSKTKSRSYLKDSSP